MRLHDTILLTFLAISCLLLQPIVCEVKYEISILEPISQCEDYENEFFIIDMELISESGDEYDEESMVLNGTILLKGVVKAGFQIYMTVYKILEIGKELVFNTDGDICQNLGRKDAPWSQILDVLKCTKCDIDPREFIIRNLKMNMGDAQQLMVHEFCGDYEVEFMIYDETMEQKSCHVLCVRVYEKGTPQMVPGLK